MQKVGALHLLCLVGSVVVQHVLFFFVLASNSHWVSTLFLYIVSSQLCNNLCFIAMFHWRGPNTYTDMYSKFGVALELILKMPRKPASENVVCLYRLLKILANVSNLFFIQANSVDPDQTAPRGAVWSGSTLFEKNTFEITSRWQSRRQLLWLAV